MSELKNSELEKVVGGAGKSGKATVTADTLNVRKEPNGEILGHLHKGDAVTVLGTKSGWCQIKFHSQTAYVYKDYLKF